MPILPNARHERRFYVYELIDPRTGSVFYVGKGTGRRDTSHMRKARRGCFANPAKTSAILEIENSGNQVQVNRVAEGLSERQAFRLERARIARYGLANLTNIAPGNDTEADRAEAVAMDVLRTMAQHISAIVSGVPYTPVEVKRVFLIIRELREALSLIRCQAGV